MYISLDLETTGFYPEKDKIIEFGAVKFDLNGHKETLQFLINPGITIPQIITHITHIKNDDLLKAAPIKEKLDEIKAFIGDLPIIGHNIQFDINFLVANGIETTNPLYDTCQLSSILLPNLNSYSLEILSKILNLTHKEKHRALDDAIATMELFLRLKEEAEQLPEELMERIKKNLKKSDWQTKNFLMDIKHTGEKPKTQKTETFPGTSEPQELLEELISTKTTSLFEIPPPYKNLVKNLSSNADRDTVISLPYNLFQEIEQEIPDTVAKIDSVSKYISPHRLELFEQKTHLTGPETTALLKYIIWLNQTKTGLLNEVALFNEEKLTIQRVNIDPNLTNLNTEPFFKKAIEKDKTSPSICTHQYLIENPQKIKDLIILDIDQLIKSLHFKNTVYLKLDIFIHPLQSLDEILDNNEIVKTLIAKSTIVFGLIGILFKNFNDGNAFVARSTITNLETNSKYWIDIKNAILQLIENSKNLIQIAKTENKGHLKNWKENLKKIHDVFFTESLETHLTWIEEDFSKNLVIRKAPFSTKKEFQEMTENCKNYKIISECIDLKDNGEFIKKLTGLKDLPIIKSEKRKNTEIYLADEATDNEISNFLTKYTKNRNSNTAIILNSKSQLEFFTLKLSPYLNIISQMTSSAGKLAEQFSSDSTNTTILMTPQTWNNFEHSQQIDNLIIYKIPFDPPSDPYLTAVSQNFEDPFNELQIPRAIIALKKAINRLPKTKKTEVIILDPRVITKGYSKIFIENLETLGQTTQIDIATFL